MSERPGEGVRKTLRLIMYLYGNRGYSFEALMKKFSLSENALRNYLLCIGKMSEFDMDITKHAKSQKYWVYRIRPESSLYKKELKLMQKYEVCG